MSVFRLERLDASLPEARQEYERAFYEAFVGVTSNRLIRSLWVWDDAEHRLATKIRYEDQILQAFRNESGGLHTAIGVNVALREFQSSAYGFLPPSDTSGCCEFLTYFSIGDHRLSSGFQFWASAFEDLRSSGFHTAYATTAARVLGFYRRMGATVLEERAIEGEDRFFLKFDLTQTQWRLKKKGSELPETD